MDIRDADIFEILLDHFPDMIHSIDDDGTIVYTNRTAEALLGYPHHELIGMNIFQIYADEVLEAVKHGFSDLKARGDKTVESILKAKDGTRIPVEIRSFSIYDDEGRFLRTFSILRDIREIKDLQQSLVHAGRLAAIGELASGVAHDINNPLTVILLSNEMILRELARNKIEDSSPLSRIRNFASDVQRASQSIRKLADHLRNFSRGMAENYEHVDLYDSMADALFITNNKIQSCNVAVENRIPRGRHFVHVYPNHLEQVFVNLIGNACDAMAEREVRTLSLQIEPAVQNGTPCWCTLVQDSGSGIDRKLLHDIFNSFFTTKAKGKGTGLGLSISRGIIRDHKGEILVDTSPNDGTTFRVYLPQAMPPDQTPSPETNP